jgi:hypothetical protein
VAPRVLSETFASPQSLAARETSNVEPVSTRAQTQQNEAGYFGWFGSFMAFTGANVLTLTVAALGVLLVGIGAVVTARHRRRRVHVISDTLA